MPPHETLTCVGELHPHASSKTMFAHSAVEDYGSLVKIVFALACEHN